MLLSRGGMENRLPEARQVLSQEECRGGTQRAAPRMAHDGGSRRWELDELESMKAVCLSLFLRNGCPPVPTYIPLPQEYPRRQAPQA